MCKTKGLTGVQQPYLTGRLPRKVRLDGTPAVSLPSGRLRGSTDIGRVLSGWAAGGADMRPTSVRKTPKTPFVLAAALTSVSGV
ncbi:hypothetical protein NDU88_006416 [Pleurodeles waltl]|uniref:Uncharacterized protein n=1 Tax=Pleurodeles waltl TaxID=8319 RepID=A0AAV7MZF6_PLEWA|nr:hypothetical protein NDU88_006416 [Pleurodeles waltl]